MTHNTYFIILLFLLSSCSVSGKVVRSGRENILELANQLINKKDLYETLNSPKEVYNNEGQIIVIEKNLSKVKKSRMDPIIVMSDHACFCQWKVTHKTLKVSKNLEGFYRQHQVLIFPSACGPDPTINHYKELFGLLSLFDSNSHYLLGVSLDGSGATIPNHFHAHLHPLGYTNKDGEYKRGLLSLLLDNIKTESTPFYISKFISVREVKSFIWGVEFTFSNIIPLDQIGEIVYKVIHQNIKWSSKDTISYNLIISSDNPRKVFVFLRYKESQIPFNKYTEAANYVKKKFGSKVYNNITNSSDINWRFGWYECMGGLPQGEENFFRPKEI